MLISSFFYFKGLIFSPSTFVLFKKEEEDKSYHIALLYETGSLWSALVLDFCPHRRGLTKISSPKKNHVPNKKSLNTDLLSLPVTT